MTEQPIPTGGRVQGKVALVVGGASGIGAATARLLAAEGAAVAVADRNDEGARETARVLQSAGSRAAAFQLDVTEEAAWPVLMGRLLQDFGRLDVAVNAAGVGFGTSLVEMPLTEWRRILNTNLDGVFLGTQAAIRAMRSHGTGSIINLASTAGVKAVPGMGAYCVSKAGVCMLSRVAALECARLGLKVRVNAILPGISNTSLWRQLPIWPELVARGGSEEAALRILTQTVPLKRYASAEEIAHLILYLASDESTYVTGAELLIDGGYTA